MPTAARDDESTRDLSKAAAAKAEGPAQTTGEKKAPRTLVATDKLSKYFSGRLGRADQHDLASHRARARGRRRLHSRASR